MNKFIVPSQLYTFLKFCNSSTLEKEILDCGAGGSNPTLAMFHNQGYKTQGVEYSDKQLNKSNVFCQNNNIDLNITLGDMRTMEYKDDSISFVYSYNSIFHMYKDDIRASITEVKRVLKPDGLFYLNLLSVDDCGYGDGEEVKNGEFVQREYDDVVIHSYFEDDELDNSLDGFIILRKEKRVIEEYEKGQKYKFAFLDYILKKI